MTSDEYRQFLLDNIPEAKIASGGSEIICPCFNCEIGTHKDHYHMYVSIPSTEDDVSLYHCFKCNNSGMVNAKTLALWNIYDLDFNVSLTNHNNRVMKNPKNFKYALDGSICRLTYKNITDNKLSQRKLAFINNRLGTNLTLDDCIKNKIVLNISDVFNQNNHIEKFTRHENVMKSLEQYFLGFISYDNNYINMRNLVCGKGILYEKLDEMRYVNYNIFNKQENSMKFILLPGEVNICDPNPIKVHLAEGPFDILSVKYNLRREFYNNIYCSVTGNGFKGVLRHLITVIKLMNIELHLYPDNEPAKGGRPGTEQVVRSILDYIGPFGFPVYVHLNENGKDMGVHINSIKEKIYRVR